MHPVPTRVEPRDGFQIWIEFDDGLSGEVDLSDRAHRYPAWNDRSFFERIHVDGPVYIAWSDELRIWADQLYADLKGVSLEEQDATWDAELAKLPNPPRITKVEARDGHCIWLEYDDGLNGEIDLSHMAEWEICKPWRDRAFFEQVHIDDFGAVAWSDEIDICPDAVYFDLTGKTPEEMLPGLTAIPSRLLQER